LCYSDIGKLFRTEHLAHGRRPYLDACPPDPSRPTVEPVCDEYPILTMYTMWLTARAATGAGSFLLWNAALLSIAAAVVALCLHVVSRERAYWFALAPTLLLYAFMNWDLIAVAFATAATLAFLRDRDRVSGTLLGLGAAAKLYPILLAIAFAAKRIRQGDRRGAARVVVWAGGVWLLVNLPFALTGSEGWSRFFRLSADRPPDLDSLWFIGCRWAAGGFPCLRDPFEVVSPLQLIDAMSGAVLVGTAALVWWLRARRNPNFPVWTFGLPLLILFLLTSKVYSPQFSLWLLPWFALALPGLKRIPALGLFAAFEATDVFVFVTRFTWFGIGGPDQWVFELAVVLRALVLVVCLVAWVLGPSPSLAGEPEVPTARPRRQGRGTVRV